ncbi:dicarboxylate/amino acid:cation symporter [[Acholeplasma] multilocale]|uniref:dicarboxylate/amino acid:cation symporter n=1 Tax=[Acholeplasma] multilocale TaxID=264638 RepID=UPI000686AAFD|nr:dicarboxylate/amino acid:cation symporter [[Acholeplasma] multilocale]
MTINSQASSMQTLLDNFLAISSWQALVSIFLFFAITGGLWYGLKKIKIKFIYRVLIGLGLGLIFGVVIQAIIAFPGGDWFTKGQGGLWAQYEPNSKWYNLSNYYLWDDVVKGIGEDGKDIIARELVKIGTMSTGRIEELLLNGQDLVWSQLLTSNGEAAFKGIIGISALKPVFKNEIEWVTQLSTWAQLFKQIFINGILLLTMPVVFIAIFRIVARPGVKGLKRITFKGVAVLLTSVTVAFVITFWMGYFLKIGNGMELDSQLSGTWSKEAEKSIPEIIFGYVPTNFVGAFIGIAIIPIMVLAAIFGISVKFVSKKQPEAMDKLRFGFDRAWDIFMSMLMTFMKIMPLAVLSMITTSIINRPIGALKSIGLVLGTGYVAIIIMIGLMTFAIFLTGIKTKVWFRLSLRPLIQGFATQSSNASLPVSMDTLNNDMKINDKVSNVIAPLSTSMGLVACAGVQAGLITSFLWTGSANVQGSTTLAAFFVIALFVTIIASLGIAGIPGTATVVTAGVLGALGFSAYFAPVYAVIGALDGLFDMGRTGANVFGGVYASTMVARSEGLFDEGTPLLSEKQYVKAVAKANKIEEKELLKETKQKEYIAKQRAKAQAKIQDNQK